MKLQILRREGDFNNQKIELLVKDLEDRREIIEYVDVDSVEGQAMVELYDATTYPAVLITTDTGEVVKMWKEHVPPAGDVSYYLHQA